MKRYYFYKTTNTLNGKYYLGVHSTDREKDWYKGSGTALKAAMKRYGRQNFTTEILKEFKTEKEMYEYEAQHITLKEVQDPMCYNLQTGGTGASRGNIVMEKDGKHVRIVPEEQEKYEAGGWVKYKKVHSAETLQKMRISHLGHKLTQEQCQAARERVARLIWVHNPGTGQETRIFPENLEKLKAEGWVTGRDNLEVNKKISETLKRRNREKPRSRRIYINKDGEVTSVPVDKLEKYLSEGWKKGNGKAGTVMSEERKAKIAQTLRNRNLENGSRIGIHKEGRNMFVYKSGLEEYLAEGWVKGIVKKSTV